MSSDDVVAMRYEVQRVRCSDGKVLGAPIVAEVMLNDMPALASEVIFPSPQHPGSVFFVSVAVGCYDVKSTPLDAASGPSSVCASAFKTRIPVTRDETSEVFFIHQCKGKGRGAIDVIDVLNHEPEIADVRFESPELGCESTLTVCVEAEDKDRDPLEFELVVPADCSAEQAQASQPDAADVPSQCWALTCIGPGEKELLARVYDLAQDGGEPVRIEEWLAREGYPNRSHAELTFPANVGCALPGFVGFVEQPQSQRVAEGARASLHCAARSEQALTYQWYTQDGAVSGATSSTLVFDAVRPEHDNYYHCRASTSLTSATSLPARLFVVRRDDTAEEPLPDTDQDGFPDHVETLARSNPEDETAVPSELATVDNWRNNPDIRSERSYDFSSVEGYETRSAIAAQFEPRSISDVSVPLIQAAQAPFGGASDPDLALPNARRLGRIFEVHASVTPGMSIDVPIPFPDGAWAPYQTLTVLRFNGASWEPADVAYATSHAIYVRAEAFSLFVAYATSNVLFVGDWKQNEPGAPPPEDTFLPPPAPAANTSLDRALQAALRRNNDTDPRNDVREVWVTAGTYVPGYVEPGQTPPANPRDASFRVPRNVAVLGGFPTSDVPTPVVNPLGGLLYVPDSKRFRTRLSGDFLANDGIACGFATPPIFCAISNNGENAYHVLRYEAGGQFLLRGVTVSGGYASGDANNPLPRGGGLYVTFAEQAVIEDCRFERNRAFFGGGAIFATPDVRLFVVDSDFEFNSAVESEPPTSVPHGFGGAIMIGEGQSRIAYVSRSRFYRNSAREGAALFHRSGASDRSALTVTNGVFHENTAIAGMLTLEGTDASLGSSTWFNNVSLTPGSVMVLRDAAVDLSDAILWQNQVQGGGPAIVVQGAAPLASIDVQYSLVESGEMSISGNYSYANSREDGPPTWVDALARNLRVTRPSVTVDTGTPLSSYVGGRRDMGAYETMTITPLGDSITAGGYGTDPNTDPALTREGYRDDLFARISVPQVGNHRNAADSPISHIGLPGARIDGIRAEWDVYIARDRTIVPDVILLCAGANDVRAPLSTDDRTTIAREALADLRALIVDIRNTPKTRDTLVLVATIPPFTGFDANLYVNERAFAERFDLAFNYEVSLDGFLGVAGVVEQLQDPKVVLVDLSEAVRSSSFGVANLMSTDHIHPNGVGYHVIGEAWAAKLRELMPTAW